VHAGDRPPQEHLGRCGPRVTARRRSSQFQYASRPILVSLVSALHSKDLAGSVVRAPALLVRAAQPSGWAVLSTRSSTACTTWECESRRPDEGLAVRRRRILEEGDPVAIDVLKTSRRGAVPLASSVNGSPASRTRLSWASRSSTAKVTSPHPAAQGSFRSTGPGERAAARRNLSCRREHLPRDSDCRCQRVHARGRRLGIHLGSKEGRRGRPGCPEAPRHPPTYSARAIAHYRRTRRALRRRGVEGSNR
jgi:hypothetical protein